MVELADKVADLAVGGPAVDGAPAGKGVQEAVQALVALGYSFADADHAVRQVLTDDAAASPDELIRRALAGR